MWVLCGCVRLPFRGQGGLRAASEDDALRAWEGAYWGTRETPNGRDAALGPAQSRPDVTHDFSAPSAREKARARAHTDTAGPCLRWGAKM